MLTKFAYRFFNGYVRKDAVDRYSTVLNHNLGEDKLGNWKKVYRCITTIRRHLRGFLFRLYVFSQAQLGVQINRKISARSVIFLFLRYCMFTMGVAESCKLTGLLRVHQLSSRCSLWNAGLLNSHHHECIVNMSNLVSTYNPTSIRYRTTNLMLGTQVLSRCLRNQTRKITSLIASHPRV